MLSGREVSLQVPTVVSHHDCILATLIPDLHLFQVLMESLPLLITHWTQVLRKLIHMWKWVVHLDAHVAAQVSEGSQHVVDKFCLVSGLIVAKKVLHYQNKCLPCFQFHFIHWVFELWISDELPDLRTVKDASFQLFHGQSWKSLAQVSEAVTILVQSLGELLG